MLAGDLVINEFVADNLAGLLDEDGQTSDWIEIYNQGDAAVDLEGWSLTDKAANLTKWTFPAETLEAGEFLVVFASNKDRAVAGNELHTNFQLDSDGEFLALVESDGTTIASSYSTAYPPQFEDSSYGLTQDSGSLTASLITDAASVTVLVPSVVNGGDTLGSNWTGGNEPFDESSWISGNTGVGYGVSSISDPVGYWSLDGDTDADAGGWGASTQTEIAGGNGQNDVSFVNDVPPQISSRSTQSIAFDGNNDDRITTGFNAALAGVNGAPTATISFWVKESSRFQTSFVAFGTDDLSGGKAVLIESEADNNLVAFYQNGNVRSTPGELPGDGTQWSHIVWTYDGTTHAGSRLFVDGIDVTNAIGGAAGAVLKIPDLATLTIGDRENNFKPVTSTQIADLAIWNEVLSDEMIAALASGASPVGGLVRLFYFN